MHPLLPSDDNIAIIYSATKGLCGTRKLMVDLYVWKVAGQWVKNHINGYLPYSTEFFSDLAVAFLDQRKDRSKTVNMEKEVSEYYDSTRERPIRGTSPPQTPGSFPHSPSKANNESFGNDMLTIHVSAGDQRQTFTTYKSILVERSIYFAELTTSNPETKTIEPPTDDPRIFNLCFQLICFWRIPSRKDKHVGGETYLKEYTLLCKLYLLSHKVHDRNAKNATLNAIRAKCE
ncbi:hypothetical protein BU25DRAFT_484889 [Macroventuria anomochaeta]|uniref:Uncharacterized protein n=1 Tax=Macroventuria anomochaeta TaxID=301207 RepID=A0ACB6S8F6_9PLEO|nr:uncharacterized protein BU25DRAFT_484889 [Macroventuria anomochaeta]KAF2629860.1 hypothetical protein BU25DRAFT_484889 [Macroventuria anomochaeta]